MSGRSMIGVRGLDGPAVRKLRELKDDNHSLPADEKEALENFDRFAESFFDSQRQFIARAENRSGT
jgi:hypothetical protein